ncbi:hypothetical protein STA3757_41270 [Stanieria sp. NIES-3757]|nr:hypothetical protein STA3757_41270 [Stanieria sp. NIES-3757]
MNSTTLRLLWSMIGNIQTDTIVDWSDTKLTSYVIERLQQEILLSSHEREKVESYLNTKTMLIRDLAESALN